MNDFLGHVRSGIGKLPVETKYLEIEVESQTDLGFATRKLVSYLVEPHERVKAYLFVPKSLTSRPASQSGSNSAIDSHSRLPAVIVQHQHGGEYQFGKSEVAGLVGNPDQAIALELAKRGFVTIAPDALGFEERGPYGLSFTAYDDGRTGFESERYEFTTRLLQGSTLQAKLLSDAQRALDVLQAQTMVDPLRLGSLGHSLGGQQTLFLTALDQRIKVAVSSCGYSSFAALIRDHINHNFAAYVPGMLLQGDVGDLLASIVPRPYLSLHGQDDPIFPIDGVRQSQKIAQTAYQAAGIPERLKFDEFSGGHTFLSPQRELAYQWLERWL